MKFALAVSGLGSISNCLLNVLLAYESQIIAICVPSVSVSNSLSLMILPSFSYVGTVNNLA